MPSKNKLSNLMIVIKKAVKKETYSKYIGTPDGSHFSKSECTLMNKQMLTAGFKSEGTLISTPSSKSDYPLKDTLNNTPS